MYFNSNEVLKDIISWKIEMNFWKNHHEDQMIDDILIQIYKV